MNEVTKLVQFKKHTASCPRCRRPANYSSEEWSDGFWYTEIFCEWCVTTR
ncbi:MAG: hypothetical protein QXJ62_05910 [Nitrososphaeria archaeon]